jgi:hypothetical protein
VVVVVVVSEAGVSLRVVEAGVGSGVLLGVLCWAAKSAAAFFSATSMNHGVPQAGQCFLPGSGSATLAILQGVSDSSMEGKQVQSFEVAEQVLLHDKRRWPMLMQECRALLAAGSAGDRGLCLRGTGSDMLAHAHVLGCKDAKHCVVQQHTPIPAGGSQAVVAVTAIQAAVVHV